MDWYRSTFASYEPNGPRLGPVLAAILRTRALLVPSLAWNNVAGRVLMFRLLLVLTFPASLVDNIDDMHETTDAIRAMGVMFESICVPRRFLKHLSNMWVRWSHRWLMALADIRSGRAHQGPDMEAEPNGRCEVEDTLLLRP